MKKLFLSIMFVLFVIVAPASALVLAVGGPALADSLTWAKPTFPDEASGGYIIEFWSSDGTDRTQESPYSLTLTGADTLEYRLDSLNLLYGKEYSFWVWAYDGGGLCDAGSNIVVWIKPFPNTYTPPADDLPSHVQIITPGIVTIQIQSEQ